LLALASAAAGRNFVQPRHGVITSNFGWRDGAAHNGIDIDLVTGDPVLAAFDGVVRVARKEWPYGKFIIVRHYNGLETVYAHLSKFKVKSGDAVKAGQVIALGGTTGRSTGSHLHFETRYKGVPINPRYIISFEDGKLISDSVVLKKNRHGFSAYPKGALFHTVIKGDTLFEIAKRYGTTTAILRRMNGLPPKSVLRVGQQIRIG
jgi:murein DD-endopeptidase MepM/ murein hydrolase activator NlpD